MEASHVAFFLTGRLGGELYPANDLRPALFAGYRDLADLRYDYPVVLGPEILPLSSVFDAALAEKGDRLRKIGFRVEKEIRRALAQGKKGRLSDFLGQPGREELAAAIRFDGEVIDCDARLPEALFRHSWGLAQQRKGRITRDRIERLVLRLSGILAAEKMATEPGRSPESLRASMGSSQSELIDFDKLSNVLTKSLPAAPLPDKRRKRIESLIDVLTSQRFFGPDGKPEWDFVFAGSAEAITAYRERLPLLISLAKAMEVAALEVEGEYRESKHDAVFADFGMSGLDPQDLAAFPDYLIGINARNLASQQAKVMEMLASGLPMKVVVQADDILEPAPLAEGHLAIAFRGKQFAHAAMGLSNVFVLQSPASSLIQLREQIRRGFEFPGPAIFSVFTGADKNMGTIPPYLVSAAALESRAFPALVYDPSAGVDWASRFDLPENPQVDADFPIRTVSYEDKALQTVTEEAPFTLADFVACDKRYVKHFGSVPKAQWNGSFTTVAGCLEASASQSSDATPETVPHVLMIDRENVLHKVIVDEALIRETRHCAEMWRSLQELAGIHSSHAKLLIEKERAKWEKEIAARAPAAPAAAAASTAPVAEAAAPPIAEIVAAIVEPEAPKSDDPYIETARCSTCNECTLINNKMFAYNENKQAYIADPDAGTFRQLVEAAESCQVSVIHPGKPRNPSEPGLEDLLKRAEPFS